MAIQILRKNPDLDITALIEKNSFMKQDNLTSVVDICAFTIKKYGSRSYAPAVGEEVEVWDGATKIFGGHIVKVKKQSEGSRIIFYDCNLKDYTHLMDRYLVKKAYTNQSPEAIIADIITTYLPAGFTDNNVVTTGITVEYIMFDYQQPSKAIQELAELIGYDWYVDYDKDIHFFDKTIGETAPWDITDDNGKCVNKSLKIFEDVRQVRNTIYVRGGEYVGASREDKVGAGDGTTKIFKLPYRYDTSPTVTVGGVNKTVGVDYIDSEDSYDCLWNYQEKVLKFKTAPASGDVKVTGSPMIAVLIKAQDNPSVNAYGTYEYRIVDKKIKTKEAARRRAQAEMIDYASGMKEAEFLTYSSGLRSGMLININSAILNENRDYIINKVTIKMYDYQTFQYSVSLVTARTVGIIAFLQKQIAEIDRRIGIIKQEGEVIDIIADLQDQDAITISELLKINDAAKKINLTTDAITIADSLLRAVLNSPPIWVAGPYTPTGDSDRKRVPMADRGALAT